MTDDDAMLDMARAGMAQRLRRWQSACPYMPADELRDLADMLDVIRDRYDNQ